MSQFTPPRQSTRTRQKSFTPITNHTRATVRTVQLPQTSVLEDEPPNTKYSQNIVSGGGGVVVVAVASPAEGEG